MIVQTCSHIVPYSSPLNWASDSTFSLEAVETAHVNTCNINLYIYITLIFLRLFQFTGRASSWRVYNLKPYNFKLSSIVPDLMMHTRHQDKPEQKQKALGKPLGLASENLRRVTG